MTVDAEIDARERAPSSPVSSEGRRPSPTPGGSGGRRVRRRRERRDDYSRVLLAVALVGSAMGLGGLHWAALAPSAALALLAGFFAVRGLPGRAPYAPALLPVALSLFTLVQLVPLPIGVLRLLSPKMADVWEGALSPLGEALRWGTLSADPSATLVEALKWAGYGGAIAAAIAAGARRGVRFGAILLFGCSVLVGTTTLVHGLMNFTRVYGVYIPTFQASRWHVGPFLNPNNLAGYLNLGLFSGIGLMVSRRPILPRVVMGIGVASLVAVVVLGASRAGLAAMLVGVLVFLALVLWVRKEQGIAGRLSPATLFLALGAVLGGAVVLAWLGSTPETWHALFDRNIEKIDVMRKVAPLVLDHPWFGVGRGAFEGVFPAYHFGPANVVYAHAENFVVQWIAEWGVPAGALALVAFGWVVLGALRDASRSVTGAGIWAGVLAVLLQNLLDLGLEVPGLAFAVATALGVLWGHDQREHLVDGASRRRHLAPRLVSWGVLSLGAGLAFCVVAYARTTATRDRIRIHDEVLRTELRSPEQRAATRASIREAMLRHPADPYFPRAGGILAWYSRESPMRWMARSLERGMHIGQTHFALAKMLAGLGARNQALLELRLATTYAPGLSPAASRVVLSMTRDFDDILRAAPEGVDGQRLLHAVALNLRRGEHEDLRLRCLLDALDRFPGNAVVRQTVAEDLSAALASGGTASVCGGERRQRCEELINEQITAMQELEPHTPAALMTKAQYLMSVGRATEAEALLRAGCQRFTGQQFAQCVRRRVMAARGTGQRDLLELASRDFAAAGCSTGAACGDAYQFLGSQAESIGDSGRALSYYKRAVAEEPSDARWGAVARTAAAMGDHATATNALNQMSRRSPGNQAIQRQLDEQRRRALLSGESGR